MWNLKSPTRRLLPATLTLLMATGMVGCPDAETTPDTSVTLDVLDVSDTNGTDTGADTTDVGADSTDAASEVQADTSKPIVYTPPTYVPNAATKGDTVEVHAGLDGGVRVVWDDRGIPHVYGDSMKDLAYAQGFVTAKLRVFQMHTLRSAGSGTLGVFSGPNAVTGDIVLRMLKLRSVAEKMATQLQTDDPTLYALMESYAAGVNHYIKRVNAGEAKTPPLEVTLFKMQIPLWTVADTMTIARLQTWDLGFGGYFDEEDILEQALDLKSRFDGTPLEGVERDVLNFTPPRSVVTTEGTPGAASNFDLTATLNSAAFAKLSPAMMKTMRAQREWMASIPHRKFRSHDFGSNNWVVAPEHTNTGVPLVANDTHLALRNPAIFYQLHLSNALAGGDYDVSGVNFAGAPGITLGTNGIGAWGATVFFSDVTDVYIEELTADGTGVMFNGSAVPLDVRQETFDFLQVGGVACESVMTGWVNNLNPSVVDNGDETCTLTITVEEVPHHGPIIPWSYGTDTDGKPVRMTWKWTGFEPTAELTAIWNISRSASVADFKTALTDFGVGAQNWIWGDTSGDIAWYPSHDLPIRANVAAGDYTHPPFLPMPGDGSAEWTGMVPRANLPQVTNPAKGYIVTANSDPTGTSLDNDPFNDGEYIGYVWNLGMRTGRIDDRLNTLMENGGKVTPDDMVSIQADHRSNLAARIMPAVLATLPTSGLAPEIAAMRDALLEWDYEADSGVGEPDNSQAHKNSIATSIFNAFVMFLTSDALFDEGIFLGDHIRGRLLIRMLENPASMVTVGGDGESLLWDDQDTPGVVETKEEIILNAFTQAHAWLSNPDKMGVKASGGFGTADMSQWRWGQLHTVTLKHNVADFYNIPDPAVWANGYPRHGDLFCVDASHHGMTSESMTFSGGPAIRNVYEMTAKPTYWGVIPGGQSELTGHPHYDTDMDKYWVKNLAPEVLRDADAVWAVREVVEDLIPPSAVEQ